MSGNRLTAAGVRCRNNVIGWYAWHTKEDIPKIDRDTATMIAAKLARRVWKVLARDFPKEARKMKKDCDDLSKRGCHVFPGTGLQTMYIGNTPSSVHRDTKNLGLTAAMWFHTTEVKSEVVRADPPLEGGSLFFPDISVAVAADHGSMAIFDGNESHTSLAVSSLSRFHTLKLDSHTSPFHFVVWPGRANSVLVLQQDYAKSNEKSEHWPMPCSNS